MTNQTADGSPRDPVGRVYLVGAGPGDPGLITLRGVDCLAQADVVLYDYLVNPQVLRHVRPGAERICLGQHGRSRIWPQEEINQSLLTNAAAGKCVVRLKGGDPAVFARGAEECRALAQAGIPFEIVPGITSGLAAGSYAGIPLTHGELASAVALIAGQERGGKSDSSLDFAALAKFPGTLVIYMGVTTVQQWTSALLANGKPPHTPVAIVRRCSMPDQQVARCRLDEVSERLSPASKMRPPVVVVIGDVARLDASISWFERRPLFGVRVLVTRAAEQSGELEQRLAELGAGVLCQPAIQITPPEDWTDTDDCIDRLSEFDWVVFSSANGVRFFLERLRDLGHDLRRLGSARLAAVGPGTARELERFFLRSDLQPDEYRGEALAEALSQRASGTRFLLVRASRGRDVLARQLASAGGSVRQVVVYSSLDVTEADEHVLREWNAGHVDWVTVTSSAIARSLVSLLGHEQLQQVRLASISPLTSDTLRELQMEPAAEAETSTMAGVVDAICRAVART
jgi:uroporphyrinogen III methyltransferase/synthase